MASSTPPRLTCHISITGATQRVPLMHWLGMGGRYAVQWTKQIASHYGGTTNGVVIHWPARVKPREKFAPMFTHVTDIAPTVLEAAGLPFQRASTERCKGLSMELRWFTPSMILKPRRTHTTQYFEMFGNRGIFTTAGGSARAIRIPWLMVPLPAALQGHVELYHVAEDSARATISPRKIPQS